MTHPDTTYFSYDYDQAARLNFIRENGATSGIGVLATIGYAPEGMPGAVVPSNGMITAFGYDGIGRQTLLLHDMTGSAGDVTWTYTRNPASQIATQARNNDSYAWGGHYAVNRAYTTNGLNQYTAAGSAGFNYDGNGNLITTPGPGPSEVLTFVYDIENRLVGRSSSTGYSPIVTLFHDPLGRLFSSTVNGTTTEFLYDGDALVGEYVGTNLTERYAHAVGADVPVLRYHGNALTDRRWLHADHQGSIVATSSGSGALGTIYTYDEYGIPGGNSNDRFRYTGQIWLPELGLYHYKARVYSPYLGRFLQVDPIGYDDQFNLYAYVGNDPVNRTDPTGTCRNPSESRLCGREDSPRGVTVELRIRRVEGRPGTAEFRQNMRRVAGSEGQRLGREAMRRTQAGNYQKEYGYTVHYDADARSVVSRLVEGENGRVGLPLIDGDRQLLSTGHTHTGLADFSHPLTTISWAFGIAPDRNSVETGASPEDREHRRQFRGVPFFVMYQRYIGNGEISPWRVQQY